MAKEDQDNLWMLSKFYFNVEIEGIGTISFKEVSGVDDENQTIERWHKSSTISLKRGVCVPNTECLNWINTSERKSIERRRVTISLVDESTTPVMVWRVEDAWPVKVQGVTLKQTDNEIEIELIELAYNGLTIGKA